jgi:hypothetical protein
MDIEFHYYMTYLVAAKAGFGADDAYKIAYSSQYVDDNDMILEIDKGKASAYRNYISQTMNILKPKSKLFRIYPLFHFIPGDPQSKSSYRKDGKMHWLNTTPNSRNANEIIDAAIATEDLYRIGIACHTYADTWAHQNFVGYYDDFNAMASPLGKISPNIGHADAQHKPDWPGLVWKDERLIDERRENKVIFIEAAKHMLLKLAKAADNTISAAALEVKVKELSEDLGTAIGERDQDNDRKDERIARCKELGTEASYGGSIIPEYDHDGWVEAAINIRVRGLRDRSDFVLSKWDPFGDICSWADSNNYQETDWYCFQEAVKNHQNTSWDILSASNLNGLQLPQL